MCVPFMRPCNCGHWVASAARGSREARGHTQRHLKVLGGARWLANAAPRATHASALRGSRSSARS